MSWSCLNSPVSFLKVHNYRRVLAECESLADLFSLSEAELTPLLGNAPGKRQRERV